MHPRFHSRVALAGGVLAAAALAACVRPQPAPTRPAAVASTDSLATLLHARFELAPISLEVHAGQRVTVGFGRAPWLDSAAAVRFDRAYDVARLVWDEYGTAAGVDTVAVRTALAPMPEIAAGAAAPPNAGPDRVEEYFFYPAQLTARERPRLGVAR